MRQYLEELGVLVMPYDAVYEEVGSCGMSGLCWSMGR